MNEWGRSLYGDPCRECGYAWSIEAHDAVALVAGAPEKFAHALAGRTGRERLAGLAWDVTGYVCHVGDNLRIWAERLVAAAALPSSGYRLAMAPYDQDALAVARNYAGVPLAGALWSLRNAAREWCAAVEAASALGAVLDHPDRGDMSAGDVARHNAHDTVHHLWDVERITA